ncbi:jacalin domain protein [Rhizoctonia solani AG-3 Rhs1AP]|uniref:Jacalin domain protein n=2 Tax=Rhizoctonia solani AG-3 TaxID=1086053 RepID=A0A074RTF3_9AGAM|nr:jacalin domain protein [Rhizoctonia solani AG-3 Rhs1AP]KEP48610.1 jacalin domain protein [Rhizoctonia solani 123E]
MENIRPNNSGDNNALLPSDCTTSSNENDHILKNAGWLCGFRVNNMDGPQVLANQVAYYINGAAPFIEETNDTLTEIITTHHKRESNYIHQGWSAGAVATLSPWTQSRIDATNRYNAGGTWITRRTLALRLRIQVLLEDISPAPEFEVAIEEALTRSSRFERFQAVYRALSRWGDVVPLEIEMGSSLSFTDTETNFAQLPLAEAVPFNNFNDINVFKIKTANIIRKGAASNAEWSDGSWVTIDVPATGWRLVRIVAVTPTINILSDSLQARLTELYTERFSYVPPFTMGPIAWNQKIHDDAYNASRTISDVEVRGNCHIIGLSIKYLDGVVSQGGKDGGNHHTFTLNNGEHIVEIMTCTDDEWLRGIQFITNTGRCSTIYGWFEDIPVISRSKGGVLAGLSTSSKKHAQWDYLLTGVRGIWRYDLISRIPKENDVYSDFFGAKKHGVIFNDRALIGNSGSMHISSVEVRSEYVIDSIQFTYTDTRDSQKMLKTAHHGGHGGAHHRFELENGEYIASVSGRSNESGITQLCFVTNRGRASQVYGGGDGHSFSASPSLGESGNSMRLQYIIGKSHTNLNGIMFVWTPNLS